MSAIQSKPAAATAPETISLADAVAERDWYHTLELAPGVVTPGWFDTRKVAAKLPFPDLTGLRCLDVGTFDGYWAFEMERRGASEVVAVDVLDSRKWDWPARHDDATTQAMARRKREGDGFEIAKAAVGSSVERRIVSVYDLDPGDLGQFDFVYLGSLLLHLRDPVRALEAVRSVCRGQLLVLDAIDLALTVKQPRRPVAYLDGVGRPWWWRPNLAGLRQMVAVAGFRIERSTRPILVPPGPGHPRPRISWRLLFTYAGREMGIASRWGNPHAAVLASPL
jgi:tRNA (mo5U34)-methyltransferase